jgi:hypothetical protein
MDEIKQVVRKFKNGDSRDPEPKDNGKKDQVEIQICESEEEEMEEVKRTSEIVRESANEFSESMVSSSPSTFHSSMYKYYVFKNKSVIPELYKTVHSKNKPFTIQIHKYNKVEANNIFSSSYLEYEVECPNAGWKVKRRFNDFVWLQAYLKKAYLGLPIPPIP